MKGKGLLIAAMLVAAVAIAGYFYLAAVKEKAKADDEAREDLKALTGLQVQHSIIQADLLEKSLNRRPLWRPRGGGGNNFHHHHPPPPPVVN